MTGLVALVVTYNSVDHVAGCVAALRSCGLPVVVLDNGSTDGTLEALAAMEDVEVVASGLNLGFGAGMNAAAELAAPGADLLLVNPDCRLDAEALSALCRLVRSAPDVGVCAPGMLYPSGRRGVAGGAEPTLFKELLSVTGASRRVPLRLQLLLARALSRAGLARSLTSGVRSRSRGGLLELDWVSGFCMYVRRSCWQQVGGFDERFFMYFEDVALCRRARDAGWRVVCETGAQALHHEGASSSPAVKSTLYRQGMWTYFAGYGTPLQRLLARAAS